MDLAVLPPEYPLGLAAALFAIGAFGVVFRRSVIVVLMCIELMLNAVNITFVAFGRELGDMAGQVMVFFVMTVAAAEVAVGLAILLVAFSRRKTLDGDEFASLRG